jgi:hypothetical protein
VLRELLRSVVLSVTTAFRLAECRLSENVTASLGSVAPSNDPFQQRPRAAARGACSPQAQGSIGASDSPPYA